MRSVAVACILASVSAADSVDYSESGSLSLLQTAAKVKGHIQVSAEWMPGSGYEVNKCGKGGNLADVRPDLAGWTGGDAHAVGTQKIDNAPTKEGCIENVLKDPRCQLEGRKAEIDARNNQPEYVARNKPFAYNIAAGYAPGQGKCFCSWGTVESQKDGTGNPMSSGWITCLAKTEKKKKPVVPDDFTCDLCADSDNDFDPEGKKGKCKKINENAQKSPQRCEKRKGRVGVQKRCCPDPPVECPLCPEGKLFNADNLDGKCAKFAAKATKNQEVCDKISGRKRVQKKCCEEPPEEKTPDDFALTKANECAEGTREVGYKECHDQAANYQWPGQKAGHTQRWDEEDHDPEFGVGWTFMPPGCVLYVGWRGDSHEAQVRWNPNQNGKNDGHRAKVCEKGEAPEEETAKPNPNENACIGARDNKFVAIKTKAGKCYSEVVITHKSGGVSCAGQGHLANFGCAMRDGKGNDIVALAMLQHGTPSGRAAQAKVIAPLAGTEGWYHSGHGHGYWYYMNGITRDSKVMTWKLGTPMKSEGDSVDLWFGEDLTDESESDNVGQACYDVKLTKAPCP